MEEKREKSITSGPQTSAVAVANAFLDIAEKEKSPVPPVDHMKLQKLVYYAHAWWLATHGEPLFEDDIEAWPWGPVVRDLYLEFKNCGRDPIGKKRGTELVKYGNGDFDYVIVKPEPPSDEIINFLQEVWNVHKDFSGVQLSNATHAPGEPWTIVKEKYKNLNDKPRIPNNLIKDIYNLKNQTSNISND